MNEDELRAAFADRHVEELDMNMLRQAIDAETARRRRRRAVAWTGGLALLVVAAIAVPVVLAQRGTALPRIPVLSTPQSAKPVNLLLLGLDQRGSMTDARADTITIVHVPASRERVYLISIQRDTVVDIPGHRRGKINWAYTFGGTNLTRETVTRLTGVTIDGTVTVTFGAVKRVVDSLGGVEVCLDRAVTSEHTGSSFRVGCQGIDGTRANDLLRQRRGLPQGGYDRDRNGHRVLAGIAAKAMALDLLSDPGRIAALLRVEGVSTDLPTVTALELIPQFRKVTPAAIVGLSAPGFYNVKPNGSYLGETLRPEAKILFKAIAEDSVDTFIAAHPEWVTSIKVS